MYFTIIMFSVAILIALFNSWRISRTRPPSLLTVQEWTRGLGSRIPFLSAFALTFLLLAAPAHAQVDSPGSQRQSLGSLNSAGEVFVNESQAPSELTIFSGDAVRTGETGTAILTTSGNNSLQISRRSQVVFTEDARYFAELKSGTIFVKSLGGAAGTVVRAGSFAVVPANRNVQTMVTIEKLGDGSYLLTCSAGNVGIVPLQEAPGLFLQAGQSARISPKGELVAEQAPAPASTPAAAQSAGRSNRLWLYLGLAGGGIAAGVAAAVASGGTHPPISPSSP